MNITSVKMRLFSFLYKWSRKGYMEEHMKYARNDIKCPVCHEWFSVSGIDYTHEHVHPSPDFGFHVRCGKCGHDSYWNTVAAPVALRCDEKGTPYVGNDHSS